jgi:hypothetical protein
MLVGVDRCVWLLGVRILGIRGRTAEGTDDTLGDSGSGDSLAGVFCGDFCGVFWGILEGFPLGEPASAKSDFSPP